MADTDIIVSQMPNASQVNASDLVMLTQPNSQAETGYSTAKTTVGAVATKIGNGIEFVTDLSRFNDKTLTGAINENKDSILALLPVDEVSGAVANFETDVVLPLIDVKAEIKAVETGTGAKSPSNPYVISGFTGANISHSDADTSNPTIYTVSWQTEAGEVFGGYYDFTTGKLVVTHVKLTETQLRSVNWSIGGSNSNLFGALLGNEYVYPTGANEKGDILSDIYENVGYTTINTATQAYQIALRNDGTIRIKDDRYATLQDFKDDLGNLNIIVKLATPVEYDLTPQQISPFLGVNNFFNDTNGNTTVKYKLGIQAYIDKKIAEVQALVL